MSNNFHYSMIKAHDLQQYVWFISVCIMAAPWAEYKHLCVTHVCLFATYSNVSQNKAAGRSTTCGEGRRGEERGDGQREDGV